MLFESETDLIPLLGISAVVLLFLAITAGIIAAFNVFKVREFQDLLYKSERKVDHLERRMFHVLNAVPVALLETDNTGKFTFANKAAHLLLGRKDNELLGLRFNSATWGITYPDGRVIAPDLMPIARTLRGQYVKGFQHLIAHPVSRSKILVSVTSMPITNANGEVIGSTSAIVELENQSGEGVGDITGIWRGQWFGASSVPFWGLDQDGTVLDINQAACNAFELLREDCIGKNWTKLFVKDHDLGHAKSYLSKVQKPNSDAKPIFITLKGAQSTDIKASLSAWTVKTQDDSAKGITLMAVMFDENQVPVITPATSAPLIHAPSPLSEDDAQALIDLRKAEASRGALGMGAWYYDHPSDSIVEDAGMRALIGRSVEGGPTLITQADQVRTDQDFTKLLNAEMSSMDLEICVDHPHGKRWIALKGQAVKTPTGLDIFGVANDITAIKNQMDATKSEAMALKEQVQAFERQLQEKQDAPAQIASTDDPYGWEVTPIGQDEPQKDEPQDPKDSQAYRDLETQTEALKIKADELQHALNALQTKADDDKTADAELGALNTALEASKAERQALEISANALKSEIEALKSKATQSQQLSEKQDEALSIAHRYETIGRLTGNVANDFQQMLSVINNALDMIQKQSDNPDHIRRLSEAALAAGKRGERLTRQLQAFSQQEEDQI